MIVKDSAETQSAMRDKGRKRFLLILSLAVLLLTSVVACTGPAPSSDECLVINALATDELLSRQGEIKIVQGIVAGAYYAESLEGQPIFLDFHDPGEGYFKAIIWGDNRDEFPPSPETYYLDKTIRVKGLIETYKGMPEVVLREPAQIWIVEYENVLVTHVIDGDTMETEDGQHVRYVGIDTPESGEPYYWEALQLNSDLVTGKEVRLEKDVEDEDRNGRLVYGITDGDGSGYNRENGVQLSTKS
jgi:hypothetical protein